jgi:type III pantothenate kinase
LAGGEPELVVADVGNTSLKLVVFDGKGDVLDARRVPPSLAAAPPGVGPGIPVVAVSVSDRGLRAFEERSAGRTWPRKVLLLGRDFRLLAEDRTETPETTGHDRLCAAVAAHARVGGAAAVVGLGTAITADAVDRGGAFLGGAIAPGLEAAAAGLAEAAPRLPKPDLAPGPVEFPGLSTGAALRTGHLLAAAGAAMLLAIQARSRAGVDGDGDVPLVVHGGDVEAIESALDIVWGGAGRNVVHAPWLVAEGARLLWIKAGRPR